MILNLKKSTYMLFDRSHTKIPLKKYWSIETGVVVDDDKKESTMYKGKWKNKAPQQYYIKPWFKIRKNIFLNSIFSIFAIIQV